MAIDPLTAKLVAKAAIHAVSDEETRRRMLILVLAPIIGILLLIALIMHIITSPLSLFLGWMLPDDMTVIENFQKEHGYNQSIGIFESDYIDGIGIDYSDIVFKDGVIDVVYFNQLDVKYADMPYGTDKIGTHGCGPASLAIVISSLTEQNVNPIQMAEWAVENGGWCEGSGSYHTLIPNAVKSFGLDVEDDVQNAPQKIIDALLNGKLVIALMSKGHFTSSGHYIVLRGITEDGKILVADPASMNRSEGKWDFNIILNEARKGADAGGAFWIISR